MSSPGRITHSSTPQSIPSRLSQSEASRSPESASTRRRPNSLHGSSTSISGPLAAKRMSHPISSLPPHRSGDIDKDGGFACRDHNTTAFQWTIRDLAVLKDHVESDSAGMWTVHAEMNEPENLPEVLRRGVVIGEGWYKLDIARSIPPGHTPSSTIQDISAALGDSEKVDLNLFKTLSLYIAALSLDHLHYSYAASIFAGIKTAADRAGHRHAPTQWYWHTSVDWEFTANTEYWECRLPKISELLKHPTIAEEDAFTLCVQIGSPMADRPNFSLPGRLPVPEDLIDALGGLFDSKTGDVRFTCLEHLSEDIKDEQETEAAAGGDEDVQQRLVSRKRVLHAHAAVLRARGDYFDDLLHGGFSESEIARRGEARVTPIVVDDADFNTVYWMLKFIYTNSLDFADEEDVRAIMRQGQLCRSEVVKSLTSGAPLYTGLGEWDYRRLPIEGEDIDDGFDVQTVKSVSSTGTRVSGLSPSSSVNRKANVGGASSVSAEKNPTTSITPKPGASAKVATRPAPATPTPIRPRPPPNKASSSNDTSNLTPATNPNTSKHLASQTSPAGAGTGTGTALPSRQFISRHGEPDPHPHPAPQPLPASALAIYMLSHRYRLETLELLAKDHILAVLRPDNCMSYLLASYSYDNLHREILDYVIDNWVDVQPHPEFLKCIQEVSSGTWGESGGLVLHGLFRRL
ncbi:hypothetical protein BD324DRAFT_650828 [Kockovaella imperatae]|uniref:BTB domain-containing protein n=1 Tax=Kockovaella imperatae TaxID=4999 RepID=A0A1Y1UGS4_9TREE|nr:hypothetical protein BD324DRAFT_650828 [Kockovaella imperatae]ORX37222.1 hypothetical protein BD324DRAFT_650828 [Kockovaella imperatae]